jgi:hypothetical protein
MGGAKNTSGAKSKTSSTKTTTTASDFASKLHKNNIVVERINTQAPDDIDEIKKLLNQPLKPIRPNTQDYQRYLRRTEGNCNELSVQFKAYTLLAEQTTTREDSGYLTEFNIAWNQVDSSLTNNLSYVKPDVTESWPQSSYPDEALDELAGFLSPTTKDHKLAMPAYAVELKGTKVALAGAHLQCAYDGAVMTEAAHAIHRYLGKPDKDFYGKTQAFTIAFNGETLVIYAHHAVLENNQIKYHRHPVDGITPGISFDHFESACKYIRNTQAVGYTWVTERRDALRTFVENGEEGDKED